MKKIVAVFLCSMMLLSLLSCNAENTNANENIDTDTTTTTKVQTETDNENIENTTSTTEASTHGNGNENGNTYKDLSVKSKSQIAMEAYVAALKSEIKIYETDIEEYTYLKDCKTPYTGIPLC